MELQNNLEKINWDNIGLSFSTNWKQLYTDKIIQLPHIVLTKNNKTLAFESPVCYVVSRSKQFQVCHHWNLGLRGIHEVVAFLLSNDK